MDALDSGQSVIDFVNDYYDCIVDYPWQNHPNFAVLRHGYSRAWFGLVMDISESLLGISDSAKIIEVLNLKADPREVEFLIEQPGIFPAYHMNKKHWVSVLLDAHTDTEQLRQLIDDSFTLTQKKVDEIYSQP
ncbi:MmcQ/YjbR family DNA-binding protein [Alloscardovia criceti]|uniref:MmcQ/YjbR family DNA-binding protein n=1 Tax=Alloscardovia criceti TaxID=356828 RepID=UPI00037E8714|nr:MmcQ/YjbR family DNA-binding protein [Alloscardovia criceti]